MAISVVVVARDEQENIGACVASAAWAHEVLVVDTGSRDATAEVARAQGARVMEHEWLGYGPTKNWAFGQARGDWVLSLDADERVSEALAREIPEVVSSPRCAGYEMPRRFHLRGRWLRHGGCYPDYQLRLFRRGRAHYDERSLVHERLLVQGPVGRLRGHLDHFSYPTFSDYLRKLDEYSTLWAREAFARGRRARWHHSFSFATAFLRRYLLKAGFLDGAPGATWALFAGLHSYAKYVKLAELERAGRGAGGGGG